MFETEMRAARVRLGLTAYSTRGTDIMDWYVVHTFSNYEKAVKRSLEERIKKHHMEELFGEILVPTEKVRRGKVMRDQNLMPGYLFISMDMADKARSLVQNTPKVTGFLGGKSPHAVRRAEIDRMLGHSNDAVGEAEDVEQPAPKTTYKIGQQVRVKSGAFANFTGEIKEVNGDKQKIWMLVSLFGRPTRVEVDFTEVEAVT
jgi:transcriptional antiterminator NusG